MSDGKVNQESRNKQVAASDLRIEPISEVGTSSCIVTLFFPSSGFPLPYLLYILPLPIDPHRNPILTPLLILSTSFMLCIVMRFITIFNFTLWAAPTAARHYDCAHPFVNAPHLVECLLCLHHSGIPLNFIHHSSIIFSHFDTCPLLLLMLRIACFRTRVI